MARSDRRREPAFDDDRGDDLRAERRGARKTRMKARKNPRGRAKTRIAGPASCSAG